MSLELYTNVIFVLMALYKLRGKHEHSGLTLLSPFRPRRAIITEYPDRDVLDLRQCIRRPGRRTTRAPRRFGERWVQRTYDRLTWRMKPLSTHTNMPLQLFPWSGNGILSVIQCRINMDSRTVSDKLLSARDNPLTCPVVEDDEQ